MERLFEPLIVAWLPLGYVALWVFVWKYGPDRGTKLAGPFANPINRNSVVRFAGRWSVLMALIPLILMLFSGGADREFVYYHLMFIAGLGLAYLHIRFRRWV